MKPVKHDPRGLSWGEAVDNAVAAERRFRQLNTLGAGKLSAKAFRAKAFEIAGADEKRVAEIAKMLNTPDMRPVEILVRNLARAYAEPNYPEPIPQAQLARFVRVHGTPETRAALSSAGISLGEAFACAAYLATRDKPKAFGNVNSRPDFTKELTRLIVERARLFSIVEAGWTAQDVDVLDPPTNELRDQGYTRTVFRRGGGVVAIGSGCGERLAGHLIDADSAKRAA